MCGCSHAAANVVPVVSAPTRVWALPHIFYGCEVYFYDAGLPSSDYDARNRAQIIRLITECGGKHSHSHILPPSCCSWLARCGYQLPLGYN
jgi:hypothetical protein